MTTPTGTTGAGGLGGVGLGATLAGGLLSAYGSVFQGDATQKAYNYRAQVAKINSNIDLQNEEYASNQGEQEATKYGMSAAERFGAIRAGQGASNVDVNSGSAKLVQGSQDLLTRTDLTQIRSNAAKTAYDYGVRSTADLNQATLDITTGENAKTAGDIGAASSILGTVGSVSSKWLQGSQIGMWGNSRYAGAPPTMGLDGLPAIG